MRRIIVRGLNAGASIAAAIDAAAQAEAAAATAAADAAAGVAAATSADRTAAQAARVGAEVARDDAEALVISDLGTTDGQTRALIQAPASQTAQALSATVAAITPYAMGWRSGDATTAIQAALNKAAADRGTVLLDRMYTVSNTLRIASNVTIMGQGEATGVSMTDPTKPALASHSWFPGYGNPGGFTTVRDLTIEGGSVCLIVRDFFSTVKNVRVSNAVGSGLVITDMDSNGTPAGGSMVENRIESVNAANNGGYGIHIDASGPTVTDGFMVDVVVYGRADNTPTPGAIRHESFAGWKVDGIHTYGVFGTSIYLNRAYFSRLSSVQVEEGWTDTGVYIENYQRATHLDNISVMAGVANTGPAVAIFQSTDPIYADDDVHIGSLSLIQDRDHATTGVSWVGLSKVRVGLISAGGDFANRITKTGGFSAASIVLPVTTEAELPRVVKRQGWDGGGAITKSFTVTVDSFGSVVGTLHIGGAQFNNGGQLVKYAGQFFISTKDNGAGNSWSASLTEYFPAVGFTTPPALSVTGIGSTRTVTVTWTPNTGNVFGGSVALIGA